MQEESNSQRTLVRIIKEICSEDEISCESFSYDWIFRLSKYGKVAHIYGYQFEINSATSHLICSDKCSTSDMLLLNKVPVVEHNFFMSPTNIKYVGVAGNWTKLCKLLHQHRKLVCKANEGSGGNDIYLVSNQFELENAVDKIFRQSRTMAVCPYYELDSEFRVVILNNNIKLIYQKNLPYIVGDGVSTLRDLLIAYIEENADCLLNFNIPESQTSTILRNGDKYYLNWKHNLGQGAVPVIVQDQETFELLSNLALQAAKAVNIQFASVDIIRTGDKYLVLEINSGVMMEHFSQINNNNYQIAKSIYKEAIESMFK